jgi:hypothetical protein
MMIGRKILGSFICVFLAWLIPSAIWVIIANVWLGGYDQAWAFDITLFAACFVVPVWLLIFMPLYVLTPPRSWAWRWFVVIPAGASSGIVIIFIFTEIMSRSWPSHIFAIPSALIGGLTGLFASLTRRWFVDQASNG